MQCIFKDERRGVALFWANPAGTDRICPPGASRMSCVGAATRCHPLLPGEQIRPRHDGFLIGSRP